MRYQKRVHCGIFPCVAEYFEKVLAFLTSITNMFFPVHPDAQVSGRLAQLVAHYTHIVGVTGSSPVATTIYTIKTRQRP